MLDDETVGALLAGQAKCEEQNKAIHEELRGLRGELTDLAEKQALDDDARKAAQTTKVVLRWVGGVCTVVLLPFMGWLAKEGYEHYRSQVERIDQVRDVAHENELHIGRHEDTVGHEPLRAQVRENGENVSRIETSVDNIEDDIETIQSTQQEILQHVRRRRTW